MNTWCLLWADTCIVRQSLNKYFQLRGPARSIVIGCPSINNTVSIFKYSQFFMDGSNKNLNKVGFT